MGLYLGQFPCLRVIRNWNTIMEIKCPIRFSPSKLLRHFGDPKTPLLIVQIQKKLLPLEVQSLILRVKSILVIWLIDQWNLAKKVSRTFLYNFPRSTEKKLWKWHGQRPCWLCRATQETKGKKTNNSVVPFNKLLGLVGCRLLTPVCGLKWCHAFLSTL